MFVGKPGPKRSPSVTRRLVASALGRGLTYAEAAAEVGISKSTVTYHARRLGLPADDRAANRYDWPAIQRAYDQGLSVRTCAARFGFCLDSWAKAVKRGAVRPRPGAMPIADLLVVGRRTNRSHLKARLLREGLKENRCEICGITRWLGKPLSMELHHVNGEGADNRLENLQLLCGNCHSQTDNWGGRGLGRKRVQNG